MSIIIELPKIPALKCGSGGKLNKKDLDAYLKNIARTTSRLALVSGTDKTSMAIIEAVTAIEKLVKTTLDPVTTKPFENLACKELEAKYNTREITKDIEEFFKKKVVDILLGLVSVIGVPNPFIMPIPFIGAATLTDENEQLYSYTPVIVDLFSKSGQKKVKAAIKQDIEKVKAFFTDIESTFNGDLGIKSPDLESEEVWHKVKNWFNQLINDFIGSVSDAIAGVVKSIPVVGSPVYNLVAGSIDPTIAIEKSFDIMIDEYKKKIKKSKDDLLEGKTEEDIGEKLLKEVIDKILAINIPFVGSVGSVVDLDIDKKDLVIPEFDFHDVEDAFKELIQKARRFFEGGIIVKINDILSSAPTEVLEAFPIVGTIVGIVTGAADLLSGKSPLTECQIINIIFPAVFNIGPAVEKLLPSDIEVKYIE